MSFYEWMQSALLGVRQRRPALCPLRHNLLSNALRNGHKGIFEALCLRVEFHNW